VTPRPRQTQHQPHPRETSDRCALRAQLRGDPMLGTAFPAARLLLVEQPGPWGHAGLRESRLDGSVARRLENRAQDDGVRVQAIRRPGRTPRGALRQWMAVDCRDGRESVRIGTYDADADLLDLPLDGSSGQPDDQPVYLVCAHSKHDACCALRGRHVAAAISRVRPGRAWECSHLGGDRFAANVLVLPSGLLYGRVLPFAAAEFVAAAEADEVVGALLRGRVGLPSATQAALAFAYEHLAVRSRSALRVVSSSPARDGLAAIRIAGPHGLLDVTVRVEKVAAAGLTCSNPRSNQYLSYRPVSIVALD
jgi:Sucrase/ferredoxin-like